MASSTIQIPTLSYASHFYPELLEDLVTYLRTNCPELTDEDPTEPHIQMCRASAASGHHNMVMLDMVANEMFLPTAKLRSSHADLLSIMGQKLKQGSPASTDLLGKLTQTFSTTTITVPKGSKFSNMASRGEPSIDYEALTQVSTARTDRIGSVISWDGSDFTDNTSAAQAGTPWNPWTTTAANNAIYFGHTGVMWDLLRIVLSARGAGTAHGVWEYYDGEWEQNNPSSVSMEQVAGAAALVFDVTSVLGSSNRTGSTVRVRCNLTGAYQDVSSTFVGGKNVVSTSGLTALLGQAEPSLSSSDYTIGCAWRELSILSDGTSDMTIASSDPNDVTYTLPWSVTNGWNKTPIGLPAGNDTMYWMRWRVVAVSGNPTYTLGSVSIVDGNQYQMFTATQGRSYEDDPLGSSDGSPSQRFQLSNYPVIDDATLQITVTEGGVESVWTCVDDFLNSLPTDKHYTKSFDDDGICDIVFGDGNNGKIPDTGTDNIKSVYRCMDADQDGNVGANSVIVNTSGISWFASVTNPRAASGWAAPEGSTEADMARVKVAAPTTLRANERAVFPGDVETLATAYVSDDGSRPIARAISIEEAFGPKTVEVAVVGLGGEPVGTSVLDDMSAKFNSRERTRMNCMINNRVYATNFIPKAIDINVIVENGEQSAVLTALAAFLHPLAKNEDGSWKWYFGSKVAVAKLTDIIMHSIPNPTDLVLVSPSSNVLLGPRELPILGTVSITITKASR